MAGAGMGGAGSPLWSSSRRFVVIMGAFRAYISVGEVVRCIPWGGNGGIGWMDCQGLGAMAGGGTSEKKHSMSPLGRA